MGEESQGLSSVPREAKVALAMSRTVCSSGRLITSRGTIRILFGILAPCKDQGVGNFEFKGAIKSNE